MPFADLVTAVTVSRQMSWLECRRVILDCNSNKAGQTSITYQPSNYHPSCSSDLSLGGAQELPWAIPTSLPVKSLNVTLFHYTCRWADKDRQLAVSRKLIGIHKALKRIKSPTGVTIAFQKTPKGPDRDGPILPDS